MLLVLPEQYQQAHKGKIINLSIEVVSGCLNRGSVKTLFLSGVFAVANNVAAKEWGEAHDIHLVGHRITLIHKEFNNLSRLGSLHTQAAERVCHIWPPCS